VILPLKQSKTIPYFVSNKGLLLATKRIVIPRNNEKLRPFVGYFFKQSEYRNKRPSLLAKFDF
jgi:hypothetical protein